jgi:hypothetical protein
MIDPHNIPISGYITLGIFWYLISLWVVWTVMNKLFKTALKSYTEALREQYREALDNYKRQHRV